VPRESGHRASARAVVVNSGNANAFTGKKGRDQADRDIAAKAVGCKPNEIFIASTGVIGEPLDATKFDGVLATLAPARRPTAGSTPPRRS
jgi:glutamate N-acetyltransferase/amino-acid N-acetyltransferase